MNLKRAGYLVAVAEHLSFTRAATELFVAQSALSQQIKVLERELGVELFDRRGPRIALTPAGEVAVREAKYLLAAADRAAGRIRRAARGAGGTLTLALTRSWAGGRVGEAIAEFRRRPEVEVIEHRGFSAVNLRQVVDGAADVGVVRQPVDAVDGVTVRRVDTEPVRLAVPAGHPLAAAERIDPRDLDGEPMVLWPRENAPGFYDRLAGIWPGGTPRTVRHEADDELVLRAVADGVGVAPIPAGRAATIQVPGVVLRELAGPAVRLAVGIASLDENPNPAVADFLGIVDQLSPPVAPARRDR
ncbi:LysR family transcriptional regulator [Gordonia caeni]|uniref:LysR family transcriptional regulator n=1 Tax=Gordonia caeni TaxID=1007097 RepID=A0ABP7PRH4_9ACTN